MKRTLLLFAIVPFAACGDAPPDPAVGRTAAALASQAQSVGPCTALTAMPSGAATIEELAGSSLVLVRRGGVPTCIDTPEQAIATGALDAACAAPAASDPMPADPSNPVVAQPAGGTTGGGGGGAGGSGGNPPASGAKAGSDPMPADDGSSNPQRSHAAHP